jgi:REP element-mobilizing transposase RayT
VARFARVVVPDLPPSRDAAGNRRQRIFFETGDEQVYLDLLSAQLRRRGVACWSYCLMPNHVHLAPRHRTRRGWLWRWARRIAATRCSWRRGPDGLATYFRAGSL